MKAYYYFFRHKMKLSESERPSPCHQLACTTSWTCLIFSQKLQDSQTSKILRYYILREGILVSGTISHSEKKLSLPELRGPIQQRAGKNPMMLPFDSLDGPYSVLTHNSPRYCNLFLYPINAP